MDRSLPIRGLLYDLARGQRAHLPYLRSLIDRLAAEGFNLLALNLEHRFEFPSCPGIAPPGSLSAADAKKLVAYGRRRGIEVVAQPNFVGHCEGIAATERYAELSADPYMQAPWGGYEQLNLELPESRRLVKRMMADVVGAFPGRYLHIGFDEVRRMDYLFPGDKRRQLRAMREQLRFVLGLARHTGRQVMMWGDMLIAHEQLLGSVPRSTIICDWHYGPEGSRDTLRRFQRKGYRVLACPAVPTYDGFLTDPDLAKANIERMIGDARSLKLEGFLLTTWEFDFGCSFETVWPWVEMAADVAAGRKPRRLSRETATLHRLMSSELRKIFTIGGSVRASLSRMRKLLFRGAEPSTARPGPSGAGGGWMVWEPSPFLLWLYLRPILNDRRLSQLQRLSRRVDAVAKRVSPVYRRSAVALNVLTDRLVRLNRAKRAYHAASRSPRAPRHLRQVIRELQQLRPGLRRLKTIVHQIDASQGCDAEERQWLDVQERSLDQHIAALRTLRPAERPLIEFGEFLRRPAGISQRVTWR